MSDHHTRAANLRRVIADCWHLNVAWEYEQDISLDGEIPCIPHRYALKVFRPSRAGRCTSRRCEDALGPQEDEVPHYLMDLDTGEARIVVTTHTLGDKLEL